MAISDKDFYASYGFDFDYKNMLDEYIKGVIKQAKIEVLTEIQLKIEELNTPNNNDAYMTCSDLVQEKINALKEKEDGSNNN